MCKVFGGFLSFACPHGWVPDVGHKHLAPQGGILFIFVKSFLTLGHCALGGVFGEIASVPLLPILMLFFGPLFWRSLLRWVLDFFRGRFFHM